MAPRRATRYPRPEPGRLRPLSRWRRWHTGRWGWVGDMVLDLAQPVVVAVATGDGTRRIGTAAREGTRDPAGPGPGRGRGGADFIEHRQGDTEDQDQEPPRAGAGARSAAGVGAPAVLRSRHPGTGAYPTYSIPEQTGSEPNRRPPPGARRPGPGRLGPPGRRQRLGHHPRPGVGRRRHHLELTRQTEAPSAGTTCGRGLVVRAPSATTRGACAHGTAPHTSPRRLLRRAARQSRRPGRH